MAIAAPRRGSDRDEHRFGALDAGRQVGRESQPPALDIGLDQGLKPRLPDRHLAGVQAVDLAGVLVDADHLVAKVGKARARDEPDITGADHCNAHGISEAP